MGNQEVEPKNVIKKYSEAKKYQEIKDQTPKVMKSDNIGVSGGKVVGKELLADLVNRIREEAVEGLIPMYKISISPESEKVLNKASADV